MTSASPDRARVVSADISSLAYDRFVVVGHELGDILSGALEEWYRGVAARRPHPPTRSPSYALPNCGSGWTAATTSAEHAQAP